MAKQVQIRRGTTTEHTTFTGANGEITIDGDKDTVVVHDGSTVGGFPLARQDMSNVSSNIGLDQLNISNEGTIGQVLQKGNNGDLTFVSFPNTDLNAVGGDASGTVGNININPNTIGIDELNISDSTFGKVLATNGNGELLFLDVAAQIFLGGELSGEIGNAIIEPDVVDQANLKLNSVGVDNIIINSIINEKIVDSTIRDPKIVDLDASKLIADGTLPALKGPGLTELPYDVSFIAGFDSETVPLELELQVYGEMIMARSGFFEGDIGFIANTSDDQPIIVDVLKNDTSIYATKPFFPNGSGSTAMTPGVLETNNTFVAGDLLTFKVTQRGTTVLGSGLRFTLKCRV
jgi:hypothetical protein